MMRVSSGVSLLLWLLLTYWCGLAAGTRILAVSDTLGKTQQLGYEAAIRDTSPSQDINITYRSTQCSDDDDDSAALIREHVSQVSTQDVLIVGGYCTPNSGQSLYPQMVCSTSFMPYSSNLINFSPTIQSLIPALANLCNHYGWQEVGFISSAGQAKSDSKVSSNMMKMVLHSHNIDVVWESSSFEYIEQIAVVVFWELDSLCEHVTDLSKSLAILLTVTDDLTTDGCHMPENTVIISTLHSEPTLEESQVDPCSYDMMSSALNTLAVVKSTVNTDFLGRVRLLRYTGQTGDIEFSSRGWRQFNVSIGQMNGGQLIQKGMWYYNGDLNMTENISVHHEVEKTAEDDNIAVLGVKSMVVFSLFSALALLAIIYTVAILLFNYYKSKDRVIKLTSPNINIVICVSCLLSLASLPLFGLDLVYLANNDRMSSMKQAGIVILSISMTSVYASVLAKTWRVHRIFRKMYLSSKGTKDEHLILIILGFSFGDAIINTVWFSIDPVQCSYTNQTYQQTPHYHAVLCKGNYILLWTALLTSYKLAIIVLMSYYAWHIKHVKLPSLKDSQLILTNGLITGCIAVIIFPAISSVETSSLTMYSAVSLAVIISTVSTISLLLLPKVYLLKHNDGLRSSSAVKFLFGESMKKSSTESEEMVTTGCLNKLRLCSSKTTGSNMGDSILAMEVDTLKQLIKQKEESIRDLTDRLFFGTGKFQEYLQGKSTPRAQKYATAQGTQLHSQQTSPAHPKTVSSILTPSTVHASQNNNRHYIDKYTSSKRQQQQYYLANKRRGHRDLTPIKEVHSPAYTYHNHSKLERSGTPTTDSAINMSQTSSSSSSDDEQYTTETKRRKPPPITNHQLRNYKPAITSHTTAKQSKEIEQKMNNTPSPVPHRELSSLVVGESVQLEIMVPITKSSCPSSDV